MLIKTLPPQPAHPRLKPMLMLDDPAVVKPFRMGDWDVRVSFDCLCREEPVALSIIGHVGAHTRCQECGRPYRLAGLKVLTDGRGLGFAIEVGDPGEILK
jgi:hypothetical protein